jgi:hypothetical protein
MATLQEQYNSIKSGSGNKDQFLKHARNLFPEYFNQYTDFNTAANVLKSKQIISEAVGGVVSKGFDIWDWKKILAEEVKAEEKTTSKEVLDDQKNSYDNSDMKNADNVNFNEIMKGFYAEMRDEKNAGKTGDEIKAMVVKNLAKDPLFYTKDGMFGEKGVGYTDEAPGLGIPKEPKGKHKASGYGDLDADIKIEKVKSNVQDSLGDKEASTSNPKKVKEMPDKGVTGVEKKMKLKEGIGMFHDPIGFKKPELSDIDKMFTKKYKGNGIYVIFKNGEEVKTIEGEGNANAWINDEKRKLKEAMDQGEQKLRSLIRNIIKEELNEGSIVINGKTVRTYTQNGDTSYNVTYDDGTKDRIAVNNDGWDEIYALHKNATNSELTEESKYEDTMPKYRLGALKKLLDISIKDGSPQDVITSLQNAIQSLEKQA